MSANTHRLQHEGDQSSQARLMKKRGDLSKTAFRFNASLLPPGPNAREKGLGMDVVSNSAGRGEILPSLLVTDVDNDPRLTTPVAEWNMREYRQAHRSDEEARLSLAIKPGDRIRAVNGMRGNDVVMTELLVSAADVDSPKALNLTLERSRSDVLDVPPSVQVWPKLSTSGKRHSVFHRGRSNSNPGSAHTSRSQSVASQSTACRPGSRSSEQTGLHPWRAKWTSLLSASSGQTRGRQNSIEDETSTRSPSVSLSGRSSSASTAESARPQCVGKPKPVQKSKDFARIGRATFSN